METNRHNIARLAFQFVLIVGVVNFFADMTYEGGRSIVGPYLGVLGASAAAIGFVAGFGELVGFALRSVTGYLADKTHRYWTFAFVGYAVNMLAVPALALAGNWPLAAALVVAERTGRAIRKPSMEAMLSQAGRSIGHGWVFGLNEALDQTGATLGPLIAAFILYRRGGYPHAFGVLLVSAVLCLATLVVALLFQKRTGAVAHTAQDSHAHTSFSKAYWVYVAGGALIAAGFADFSLIAFHFQRNGTVTQDIVPVFYAVAMATGAIAAPIFGKLLDKLGLPVLLVAFGASAFFAPFVFLAGARAELVGMVLWGTGLGAQDACLKGTLSSIVPGGKRSTGFGVFDTWFGVAWFAGSAVMGLLYERSVLALVIFSVVLQLLALPFFVLADRARKSNEPAQTQAG
ncbi:MAG TPA: MFS transporter [Candidatus Bathyarchaeia archaeon]|nr:MFS transporter [Candidatus Bathyarchaeia archaeon]